MGRQIVLDTETTGLSFESGDRVLEIGCVELLDRKLTGNNLHLYVNPERASHEDALKIHGISSDFLKDKPKFAEVADDLMAYLGDAELIIHNAPFDVGFLNGELERAHKPKLEAFVSEITDTLLMAKQLYPGKRNSLNALCDRLGVDNSSRTLHGALLDAELLADVYINLTRGQEALEIGFTEHVEHSRKVVALDLHQFNLPVIHPTDAEMVRHLAALRDLNQACGGNAIWADEIDQLQ